MSMSNQSANQVQERDLTDVRCKTCNKLLFRSEVETTGKIEIKCEKCKRLCKINLPIPAVLNKINLLKAA